MQHVIRYALGSAIEQCATYQAYDKTGRAQWISQWAMNMQEHHGEFLAPWERGITKRTGFSAIASLCRRDSGDR